MFLTLQIARNRLHLLFAWLSECLACPGRLTGPGWSLTSRSLFLFIFSWLFCCGFNSVSIILSLLWLVSCWVLWDRHKSSRIRNDVKIKCLLKLLHYLCWASLFFFFLVVLLWQNFKPPRRNYMIGYEISFAASFHFLDNKATEMRKILIKKLNDVYQDIKAYEYH